MLVKPFFSLLLVKYLLHSPISILSFHYLSCTALSLPSLACQGSVMVLSPRGTCLTPHQEGLQAEFLPEITLAPLNEDEMLSAELYLND